MGGSGKHLGKSRGALGQRGFDLGQAAFEFLRRYLVGLGERDLVADSRDAEGGFAKAARFR